MIFQLVRAELLSPLVMFNHKIKSILIKDDFHSHIHNCQMMCMHLMKLRRNQVFSMHSQTTEVPESKRMRHPVNSPYVVSCNCSNTCQL